MVTIIHGDDTLSSRNHYYSLKQKFENITYLDGEKISYDEFFQVAQNQNIFEKTNVFIENFITKNKSEDFKKIISYINILKNVNLVFYEASLVSKTNLNLFKNAEVKSFLIPKTIFLFLDNLKPGNSKILIKLYKQLQAQVADEIIYFMLIRQFRLMIGLNTAIDEVKRLAPWQVSKLRSQAASFTNLEKLYLKIFEIDLNTKTGKTSFSYQTSIDFLLSSF